MGYGVKRIQNSMLNNVGSPWTRTIRRRVNRLNVSVPFSDFNGNRLQLLSKSIMEGLALANEVCFMDDWHNYDGCRAEHFIARLYGVPCVYLNT